MGSTKAAQQSLIDDAPRVTARQPSAFDTLGMMRTVQALLVEIRALYLADDLPWIVGYSGGKDSTATLQLVWFALAGLTSEQRRKAVHVISTDTLVENPIVSAWAARSLELMGEVARLRELPISPHRLTPDIEDTFWVNLIGRGYAAPRHKFRWCTERLKINPSTAFIQGVVKESGEAILVLGLRKAESVTRAALMEALEVDRVRERLTPSSSQPGTLVYSPIEAWSNDDVWMFLMQCPNPWGNNNKDLLTMYAGASDGGECPLVVDKGTPSCGDSRFGCWVCTLVDQDKSMEAMIQNDAEKEWMLPLLELRDALNVRDDDGDWNDRHLRDFRRLQGHIQGMRGARAVVPGPYIQSAREEWLRRLLKAQSWIREHGPEAVRDIELVTLAELVEIRRLWVFEKHEMEDRLPAIWTELMGSPFPGPELPAGLTLGAEPMERLLAAVDGDRHLYEHARALLSVTDQHKLARAEGREFNLDRELAAVAKRYAYASEEEALAALQVKERDRLAREPAGPLFDLAARSKARRNP